MSSRIRFSDVADESTIQYSTPINSFEDTPIAPLEETSIASLEDALKPIARFFSRLEEEARLAMKDCQQPKEGLTQEESASISLYTMQFSEGPSLYRILNRTLRAENRQDLKPWLSYLKLFLTALDKLPSREDKVWRGVPRMNLSSNYPKGKRFFWWIAASCTTDLKVLERDYYLGKKGERTLFSIQCQNGKSVVHHSYFKNAEEEIILLPGSYFEVKSVASPAEGLYMIDLKEIEPPFPTIKRLFKTESIGTTSKLTSARKTGSLQKTSSGTPKMVSYEITVYTGRIRGAGTDSQVYIKLYGKNEKRTKKFHLHNSLTNKIPFERSETDKFRVKGDYIGELVKLRIEHDNTGRYAGWFLDRIVVTDSNDPQTKYFAFCNKWLDEDEDDGQISRDLKLIKDTKYKVTVYTGEKVGAGTDADVFITFYGNLNESSAIMLYDKRNNFEAGQKDEFIIECPIVGELNKILIAHNNKGSAPGWFLNRILIDDLNENRIYEFPCNQWLAVDEDDGQISRLLYPKQSSDNEKDETEKDGIPYNITIYTGSERNDGTDARVYIVMHGDKESSNRIFLSDGEFQRKSIDKSTVDAQDGLSPLEALDIGHDNTGDKPEWFLDKVVVECQSSGIIQTFPCSKWLADDKGDKRIKRRLREDLSLRETRAPTVPWYIWIYTSDMKGASTDSRVILVLYGDNGKSDDIKLRNESDVFEAGQCDKFKVDVADVGTPYKLRVSHKNKKLFSSWHLNRIEMKNLRTNKRYTFHCGRWLSRKEDDKQIIRELPAEGPDIKRPLSVVKYMVDVYTGKQMTAGTDANVFINIMGEFGDTGERPLEYSLSHRNKFERNQVDSFILEAVSLKQLRKIRIGHVGTGPGDGWFLDKVVIRPEDQSSEFATFICDRWLATDEDDGMLSREISVLDDRTLPLIAARESKTELSNDFTLERKELTITYKVNIITGDEVGSGTNANVFIIIFGKNDDTGKVPLVTSKTHNDPFEEGHTDVFEIKAMNIDEPTKIIIGHDNSGAESDWLLERVEIDVPNLGRTWVFPSGQWLSKSKGDCKLEVELFPKDMTTKVSILNVAYEIKVYTSKVAGAGSSADVHIEIFGIDKTTGQIILCSKTDRKGKFQTGSIDTFVHELDDVGDDIEKIRIGHDNRGFGAAWHLDRVEIRQLLRGRKNKTYVFPCNRWFAKNEDDHNIIRELISETIIEEKIDESGNLQVQKTEMKDCLKMKQLMVDVYTGDIFGCGTNANVYCTIYGDKGDTGERELAYSKTHKFKFGRRQMDRFKIECADLGNIFRLKIRHDNSGISPDWLLSKVEVKDGVKTYIFYCEQWLAQGKEDSKLERTLYEKNCQGSRNSMGSVLRSISGSTTNLASIGIDNKHESVRGDQLKDILSNTASGSRDSTEEGIPYTVKIKTGEERDASTSANVSIRLIGPNGLQTRKIPLKLMEQQHFEPGKVEIFSLQQLDIGNLEAVEIEHDGKTVADSWFLDDVTIEIPTKGRVFYFACHQWLSKHKDDKKTKRLLKVQDSNQGSFRPLIPYEVTIYTGDVENAGCDCDISLKLFGTTGPSSEHIFKKDEGNFERGAIDTFECELDDVGKPIRLRVKILPKHLKGRHRWYLEKIELDQYPKQNEKQQTYFYGLNEWITNETEYYHDIPLSKGGRALLDKTTYQISTKTSDIDGATCNSNVFIIISGESGDSGILEFKKSSTYINKFQRNNEDIFTFENILSLGELTNLRIWHDNSSIFKKDWHLEYVKIEDKNTKQIYMFPCDKWLSSKKEDQQIVRELVCSNDLQGSLTTAGKVSYQIEVITSDKENAGTTQNGWIILETNRKSSEKFFMGKTPDNKILRAGQTNTFTFECRSLGELRGIVLGRTERSDHPLKTHEGREAEWHVVQVTITDPSTDIKYEFPVKQCIPINNDGIKFRCTRKKLGFVTQGRQRSLITYKIIVYTGNVSGAGTNANVSIILYGTFGDTGTRLLQQKGRNLFENGQVDEFLFECLDLGELTKLHIEHDNARIAPDWFLDKVQVIKLHTDETIVFICNRWLSKKRDDHEIQRDLLPMQVS